MCGIVGYVGNKEAAPILLQGLRRLEYRGYDSAGIAIHDGNTVARYRSVGKIDNLTAKTSGTSIPGTIGIAHTRWATHGGVTEPNAHPHTGNNSKIILAHNGIIENYRQIKRRLGDGHTYESETDSEVLAHLIESEVEKLETLDCDTLRTAVKIALKQVRGTYGVVVMHRDIPDCVVAARLGSPLVIGVGEGEHYIASDATPMLAYTKDVIFLDDGEIAQITASAMQIFTLKDQRVDKGVETIDWDDEQAEKQGFEHFTLKEIFDQPTVFEDAIRGRYDMGNGTAHLGGLNMSIEQMQDVRRIILIACGTALHAGLIGKYAFERLAGIPTAVEVASEFRYSDPIIDKHTLVFGISQSGETADTLAALREAKRKGAYVRGIVNVVGSTIARETDGGTYIHAGPELAVASTKAYTNMVAILLLYALQFGRMGRVSVATGQRLLTALLEIPRKIQLVLDQSDAIAEIAKAFSHHEHFFFIGRGVNYPVAREGSLKFKEVTYIQSEAYPGGELKHGSLALISETFPTVSILTKDQLYEKMWSNVEEVKARKGPLVLVATAGDDRVRELSEHILWVPETMELLQPLLSSVALQLFAYHAAVALGRNVDRPRNLAKSVTVE